jgi:hypothetical protein
MGNIYPGAQINWKEIQSIFERSLYASVLQRDTRTDTTGAHFPELVLNDENKWDHYDKHSFAFSVDAFDFDTFCFAFQTVVHHFTVRRHN